MGKLNWMDRANAFINNSKMHAPSTYAPLKEPTQQPLSLNWNNRQHEYLTGNRYDFINQARNNYLEQQRKKREEEERRRKEEEEERKRQQILQQRFEEQQRKKKELEESDSDYRKQSQSRDIDNFFKSINNPFSTHQELNPSLLSDNRTPQQKEKEDLEDQEYKANIFTRSIHNYLHQDEYVKSQLMPGKEYDENVLNTKIFKSIDDIVNQQLSKQQVDAEYTEGANILSPYRKKAQKYSGILEPIFRKEEIYKRNNKVAPNWEEIKSNIDDQYNKAQSVDVLNAVTKAKYWQQEGDELKAWQALEDATREHITKDENGNVKQTKDSLEDYVLSKYEEKGADREVMKQQWNMSLQNRIDMATQVLYSDTKNTLKNRELQLKPSSFSSDEVYQYCYNMLSNSPYFHSVSSDRKKEIDEASDWLKFSQKDVDYAGNKAMSAINGNSGWATPYDFIVGGASWLVGSLWNGLVDIGQWAYGAASEQSTYKNIADFMGNAQSMKQYINNTTGEDSSIKANLPLSLARSQEIDYYGRKQGEKFMDKLVDEYYDDSTKYTDAHSFEVLSNLVSSDYWAGKDALNGDQFTSLEGYKGRTDEENKAREFKKYQILDAMFGDDVANTYVNNFWSNTLASKQSQTDKILRTANTVAIDIASTLGAAAALLMAIYKNPLHISDELMAGDGWAHSCLEWANGAMETGCWTSPEQAKYRELGISANQIFKTVEQKDAFLSAADIYDLIGQYGFTAGTMLVSMGGSWGLRGLSKLTQKALLKGFTVNQAKRAAAMGILKGATREALTKNIELAAKLSQNVLYYGNLGMMGFTGSIEGALEAFSTYHTFKDDNLKQLESTQKMFSSYLDELPEESLHEIASGFISSPEGIKSYNSMVETLRNMGYPTDEKTVLKALYTNNIDDLKNKIEESALDAAWANFCANSVINGLASVFLKRSLFSNDAFITSKIVSSKLGRKFGLKSSAQKLAKERRGRLTLDTSKKTPVATIGMPQNNVYKKTATEAIKSAIGEGAEETFQNVTDVASRATFQADVNNYMKTILDPNSYNAIGEDSVDHFDTFIKTGLSQLTTKEALREGMFGFLSTLIGGVSPGGAWRAFSSTRRYNKYAEKNNLEKKSLWKETLKGLYEGGILNSYRHVKQEHQYEVEASKALEDSINEWLQNKNTKDFIQHLGGGIGLKNAIQQYLDAGDVQGAKDAQLDMLIKTVKVLDALQDTEYGKSLIAMFERPTHWMEELFNEDGSIKERKQQTVNGNIEDVLINEDGSLRRAYFNQMGNLIYSSPEKVNRFEKSLRRQALEAGLSEEEANKLVAQEIAYMKDQQSRINYARSTGEFKGASDAEVIKRIAKNALEYKELKDAYADEEKEVKKIFAGGTEDMDPLVLETLVRSRLQQQSANERFEKLSEERIARQNNSFENSETSGLSKEDMDLAINFGSDRNLDSAIEFRRRKLEENKLQAQETQESLDNKAMTLEEQLEARIKLYQLRDEIDKYTRQLDILNTAKQSAQERQAKAQQDDTTVLNSEEAFNFTAKDIAELNLQDRKKLLDNYRNDEYRKMYSQKQIQAIEEYLGKLGNRVVGENDEVLYDNLLEDEVFSLIDDEVALNKKRQVYDSQLLKYMSNPSFLTRQADAIRKSARRDLLKGKYKKDLLMRGNESVTDFLDRVNNLIDTLKQNGKKDEADIVRSLFNEVDEYKNINALRNALLKRWRGLRVVEEGKEDKRTPEQSDRDNQVAATLNALLNSLGSGQFLKEGYSMTNVIKSLRDSIIYNNDRVLKAIQAGHQGKSFFDSFYEANEIEEGKTTLNDFLGSNENAEYKDLTKEQKQWVDDLSQLVVNHLNSMLDKKDRLKDEKLVLRGRSTSERILAENVSAKPSKAPAVDKSKKEEEKKNTEKKSSRRTAPKSYTESEKTFVLDNVTDENQEDYDFVERKHKASENRKALERKKDFPYVYFYVKKREGDVRPKLYLVYSTTKHNGTIEFIGIEGKSRVYSDYRMLGMVNLDRLPTLRQITQETWDSLPVGGHKILAYGGRLGKNGIIHTTLVKSNSPITIAQRGEEIAPIIDQAEQEANASGRLVNDVLDEYLDKLLGEEGEIKNRQIYVEGLPVGPKVNPTTINGIETNVTANLLEEFTINGIPLTDLIESEKWDDIFDNPYFKEMINRWKDATYSYTDGSGNLHEVTQETIFSNLFSDFIFIGSLSDKSSYKIDATIDFTQDQPELVIARNGKFVQFRLPEQNKEERSEEGIQELLRQALTKLNEQYKEAPENRVITYFDVPSPYDFIGKDGDKHPRSKVYAESEKAMLKELIRQGLYTGSFPASTYKLLEFVNPFYEEKRVAKVVEEPSKKTVESPEAAFEIKKKKEEKAKDTSTKAIDRFVDWIRKNMPALLNAHDKNYVGQDKTILAGVEKLARITSLEDKFVVDDEKDAASPFSGDPDNALPTTFGTSTDDILRNILDLLKQLEEDGNPVKDIKYNSTCTIQGKKATFLEHLKSLYGGQLPNLDTDKKDELDETIENFVTDAIVFYNVCRQNNLILFPSNIKAWIKAAVYDRDKNLTGDTIWAAGTLDLLAYDTANNKIVVIDFKTTGAASNYVTAISNVQNSKGYKVQLSSYVAALKYLIDVYNENCKKEEDRIDIEVSDTAYLLPILLRYNKPANKITPLDIENEKGEKDINGMYISGAENLWKTDNEDGAVRMATIAANENNENAVGLNEVLAPVQVLPFKGYYQDTSEDAGTTTLPAKEDTTEKKTKKRRAAASFIMEEDLDTSKRDLDTQRYADSFAKLLTPVNSIKLNIFKHPLKTLKTVLRGPRGRSRLYKSHLAKLFFYGDVNKLQTIVGKKLITSESDVIEALHKLQNYFEGYANQEESYLEMLHVKHEAQKAYIDLLNGDITQDEFENKLLDLNVDASIIPEIMKYKELSVLEDKTFEQFVKEQKTLMSTDDKVWKLKEFQAKRDAMLKFFQQCRAQATILADNQEAIVKKLKSMSKAIKENKIQGEDAYRGQQTFYAWYNFVDSKDSSTNLRTALQHIINTTQNKEYKKLAERLIDYTGDDFIIIQHMDTSYDSSLEGEFIESQGIIYLSDHIFKDQDQLERVLLHEALHAVVNKNVVKNEFFKEVLEKLNDALKLTDSEENIERRNALLGTSNIEEFISEYFTNMAFKELVDTLLGPIISQQLSQNTNGAFKTIEEVMHAFLDDESNFTSTTVEALNTSSEIEEEFGDRADEFIEYLKNKKILPQEYENMGETQKERLRECFS